MADTKIVDLAENTSPASDDLLVTVDVSDTTMSAEGTNKKMPLSQVVLSSTVNAKGDLLVGTADNTVARLAVGSDDTFAIAASGETTGIKWAGGSTARHALGLGSMAIQDSMTVLITGGSIAGIVDLAVADGGTGASTAAGARTNLGVDIGLTITSAKTSDYTAADGDLVIVDLDGASANITITPPASGKRFAVYVSTQDLTLRCTVTGFASYWVNRTGDYIEFVSLDGSTWSLAGQPRCQWREYLTPRLIPHVVPYNDTDYYQGEDVAKFTALNLGTSTWDSSKGRLVTQGASASGVIAMRGYFAPLPSGLTYFDYELHFGLTSNVLIPQGGSGYFQPIGGLALRKSTGTGAGKILNFAISHNSTYNGTYPYGYLTLLEWTNETTFNNEYVQFAVYEGQVKAVRFYLYSGNLYFLYSLDGKNFTYTTDKPLTAFSTAGYDEVGWLSGSVGPNGSTMDVELFLCHARM